MTRPPSRGQGGWVGMGRTAPHCGQGSEAQQWRSGEGGWVGMGRTAPHCGQGSEVQQRRSGAAKPLELVDDSTKEAPRPVRHGDLLEADAHLR
eukprot:CAMPEP_0119531474 /NCGR_PEP_ID=MMETSP1344-20130328/45179_1 /TAXON_ID=236787 /ORGANISM="Florenciella parvula, Strain CCMP2471" /LENGTH=92 /DNA_ID=CAMNT_0007571749 /DNA_START=1 /DNA_END=275 /DNA_ORIENTATION=+